MSHIGFLYSIRSVVRKRKHQDCSGVPGIIESCDRTSALEVDWPDAEMSGIECFKGMAWCMRDWKSRSLGTSDNRSTNKGKWHEMKRIKRMIEYKRLVNLTYVYGV
jgi:hypothetical protein